MMLSPVARATRARASGSRASAAIGGIHEGLAARVLEEQGLVAGHALVEELEVVEVGAEVLPHPAEIGQADRLPGESALAAVRGLLEHHLEVDEEMLVGQRDAHGLPCDGAKHGLRLSGKRRSWHRGASCAAQGFTVKTAGERTLTPGPWRKRDALIHRGFESAAGIDGRVVVEGEELGEEHAAHAFGAVDPEVGVGEASPCQGHSRRVPQARIPQHLS